MTWDEWNDEVRYHTELFEKFPPEAQKAATLRLSYMSDDALYAFVAKWKADKTLITDTDADKAFLVAIMNRALMLWFEERNKLVWESLKRNPDPFIQQIIGMFGAA